MKIYRVRWRPHSTLPVILGGDLLFKAEDLSVAVQNAGWLLTNLFQHLQKEYPDVGYELGYELLLAEETPGRTEPK